MSLPVIALGVVLLLAAYLLLFVTAKRADEENERHRR
jgi:hypothetical protein